MSVNEPKSHTMSAQRTCGACGGAGLSKGAPHQGCGCFACRDPKMRHSCPVCAGSGTVDAKASREDAMADAETLRIHSARLLGGSHAWVAMQHGMMAERKAWVGKVEDSGAFAGEAARAAFRAVPGLRGE